MNIPIRPRFALPLLAVVAFSAVPASAQNDPDADAAGHPAALPGWSFGLGARIVTGPVLVASPRGDIERRVGDRTALVLGFGARYDVARLPDVDFDTGAADAFLDVGLRQLVTHVGPVRVSLSAGLRLAYEWEEGARWSTSAPTVKIFHRAWGTSLGGGVALDLPLMEGLTLRMASNVIRAGVSTAEGTWERGLAGNGTHWSAGLAIEPALELRIEL